VDLQSENFGASHLYQQGALKLNELITTRYALDNIAQGFADMHAGRNLRGVVIF
jgi:S-(hydroxymethyl)glutathione dehydrogenase/alcohol dehydrogenase